MRYEENSANTVYCMVHKHMHNTHVLHIIQGLMKHEIAAFKEGQSDLILKWWLTRRNMSLWMKGEHEKENTE